MSARSATQVARRAILDQLAPQLRAVVRGEPTLTAPANSQHSRVKADTHQHPAVQLNIDSYKIFMLLRRIGECSFIGHAR